MHALLPFRVRRLERLRPQYIIQLLPEDVQPDREPQQRHEEPHPPGQIQHVQHRVHPNVCVRVDDVQPHQVAQHEGGEYGQTDFPGGVFPETSVELGEDEHHDVGVHDVVQPPGEEGVYRLGEDQLAVDGVQGPESYPDEHGHRECERRQELQRVNR